MQSTVHPRARRLLVPAAMLALLMATLGVVSSSASAAPYTAPLTTSLAVDCDALPTQNIYWTASTGSVSVSMTNCLDFTVFDSDDNPVQTGTGNPATITVPSAHELFLYDDVGDPIWSAKFNPVYPETVPKGQLLLSGPLALPLDAPEFFVGPPNLPDVSDDEHFLGGIEDCDLESDPGKGMHVYATIEVRVRLAGEYTFRGVGTDPLSDYLSSLAPDNAIADPFFALYSGFDPTKPDDNVVGCNDDLNDLYDNYEMAEQLPGGVLMEGHQPYFTANLEPGVYTLLLTTFGEVENPTWWTDQGPGSVDFEMWGPADGLCIAADPTCKAIDPTPPSFTG